MNHRETIDAVSISYWNRTSESVAADKADATHAVVTPAGYGYPEITFAMPAEADQLETLRRFARECFKQGRVAKAAEIRAVIMGT